MPEFLSNFSDQITEYWGRFTNRQKVQIIAVIVAAVIALGVLTFVLSRPEYVLYQDNITQSEMNQIQEALTGSDITYEIRDNATALYVDSSQFQDVSLLLAGQGMLTTGGFTFQDALNSTFTTTSDQRDLASKLAYENQISERLEMLSAVDEAKVNFVMPDQHINILEEQKEASASVILNLNDSLTDEQIIGIAEFLSELVDNLPVENIRILESSTNTLIFNGGSRSSVVGSADAYLEITNLYEDKYEREIELLLFNTGNVDEAIVDVNLQFDFNEESSTSELHTLPEGQQSSLPTKVYLYDSTGSSTEGSGVPGTDANADATTYVTDNGGGSDSSVSISDTDYAVNTTVTTRKKAEGEIIHDQSSVTVVLRNYNIHNQDLLTEQGALEGTTWEQYKKDNEGESSIEVEQVFYDFVRNASLIDSVRILAYEVQVFEDSAPVDNQVADYIPVVIIVLMIAMLGYAVYRGTEPVEITEVEPELSVEDMLATTSKVTDELDSIEMNDKSEARIQIEKFVDENPEAVAQLLRNWLTEDWE